LRFAKIYNTKPLQWPLKWISFGPQAAASGGPPSVMPSKDGIQKTKAEEWNEIVKQKSFTNERKKSTKLKTIISRPASILLKTSMVSPDFMDELRKDKEFQKLMIKYFPRSKK
jgi:hypothetical protein